MDSNSGSDDATNAFSADGLELYFASKRPGGLGNYDIWVSVRQSVKAPWGPPTNLGAPVNSPYGEVFQAKSFCRRLMARIGCAWIPSKVA